MNDDRQGIERLREAIDEVADQIESRPAEAGARRPLLPWTLAAAAAVMALLAWLTWFHPSDPPEVRPRHRRRSSAASRSPGGRSGG